MCSNFYEQHFLTINGTVLVTKSLSSLFANTFNICLQPFLFFMDHCAKWQQILVPVEVVVPSFSTSFPFSLSTIRDTTALLWRRAGGYPQKTWAKRMGGWCHGLWRHGDKICTESAAESLQKFVVDCNFLPKIFGCVGMGVHSSWGEAFMVEIKYWSKKMQKNANLE